MGPQDAGGASREQVFILLNDDFTVRATLQRHENKIQSKITEQKPCAVFAYLSIPFHFQLTIHAARLKYPTVDVAIRSDEGSKHVTRLVDTSSWNDDHERWTGRRSHAIQDPSVMYDRISRHCSLIGHVVIQTLYFPKLRSTFTIFSERCHQPLLFFHFKL